MPVEMPVALPGDDVSFSFSYSYSFDMEDDGESVSPSSLGGLAAYMLVSEVATPKEHPFLPACRVGLRRRKKAKALFFLLTFRRAAASLLVHRYLIVLVA